MSHRPDASAVRHCVVVAVALVGMLLLSIAFLGSPKAYLRPRIGMTEASFESLRLRASAGDWVANRSLTRALLDRFDVSHDSEDLFEAMIWLDMDWDESTLEHTNLQFRIYKRYCDHRVLRWHWLCNAGE